VQQESITGNLLPDNDLLSSVNNNGNVTKLTYNFRTLCGQLHGWPRTHIYFIISNGKLNSTNMPSDDSINS
jgi:hypothetical protein